MKKISKTAIFFGSGPVAAQSLNLLLDWLEIEAVITKPKKEHHKDPAPVEELAKRRGLKLYFANNKKELDDLIDTVKPASEYGLVIDFGVIISEKTINYFKKGIINSHFSLLPEWRGADPITYSLLSGQSDTGVSLMLIDKGMDTGQLLAEERLTIKESWNAKELTENLIALSDFLLRNKLSKYLEGKLTPYDQDTKNKLTTYSTTISKQDGLIDINKPAGVIMREIKAYSMWPKSTLKINNDFSVVITEASLSDESLKAGEILTTKDQFHLGLKFGSIKIERLIPVNKKEMDVKSFLNGYRSKLLS